MTGKINVSVLSGAQVLALLDHFAELDQMRLASNNALLRKLQAHPDFTDALAALVNAWSADANTIGEKSDAEIQRIIAGAPRTTH